MWGFQLALSIVPVPAPARPPLVPGDHISHLKAIPFATACLECARDFSLALAPLVCEKKRVETGWPKGQPEGGANQYSLIWREYLNLRTVDHETQGGGPPSLP